MQFKKLMLPAVLASGALLMANFVSAAQIDTSFNVKMHINSQCKVKTINDIDFGDGLLITANTTATTTMEVKCNDGVPYTIALKPSNNSTVGAGAMISGANSIAYTLYRDAADTQVWGNVVGTNTLGGTTTNGVVQHSIRAKVLVADVTGMTAGNYNDVVYVTMAY